MMFHSPTPVGTEVIETQAVLLKVANVQQAMLERRPLGRIYLAFEHGILRALAEIETCLGHLAESAATFRCGC